VVAKHATQDDESILLAEETGPFDVFVAQKLFCQLTVAGLALFRLVG
jgi:hypothetical protein